MKWNLKPWFVKLLKSTLKKLEDKEVVPPVFLEDLSPIDNVEKMESYDQALSWAVANDHVKNIAVTGPYGAGKSSLLKTFEKKHDNYNFLFVSLASFQDDVKETDEGVPLPPSNITREEMHRLIELSILQQMFYRVKIATIPDSRFNRIKNLSRRKVIELSLFSVALIISVVLLFFPSFMNRFSWWPDWNANHKDLIMYLALLSALPALYKIQTYVLRLLNTSRFNKINLSKGEVEFDEKSESSVLNKHLDEILYFFEVTKFDIVVFEDLDRFNDPEIFTKLREINILVNQSLQIGRHIVFIYAIKDDMFKDKTRTKFFDFILPVIPVINYSNSYEKMVKKFGNSALNLNVTDKFLNAITLYIDDMRVLKNIFNEFMLYKENLEGITIVEDKLLAIIVYKNIFPSDFASLHDNKGIISNVFEKKPSLINNLIAQKEKLVKENTERMADFNEPLAESVKELRAIYLLEFQRLAPNAVGLVMSTGNKSFVQVRDSDTDFDAFTKMDNIQNWLYIQNRNGYGGMLQSQAPSGISFAMVENSANPNLTYLDRYALIEGQSIAEVEKLIAANGQLITEITKLKSSSLKEMLTENPQGIDIFDEDFKSKKLLIYLVREGYIDETYPSLISYFYEGSLSFKDMSFILNILNRDALEFDYELDKVENITSRLENEDYGRVQILNTQLADHLLNAQAKYRDQLPIFFKMLSNGSAESIKFIDHFAKSGTQKVAFFKRLYKAWPSIWDDISGKLSFAPAIQNQYLLLILEHADEADLKLINKSKTLEKYVKTLPGFLNWFKTDEEIKKAKTFIKLFTIKFYKLAPPEHGNELFDYIIANRFYMLTEDMIKLIIEQKGSDASKNEELIRTANYTAVQLSAFEPLTLYIADNLSDYLESITLLLTDNTKDTEVEVIKLLNNETVSDAIKNRLILKEDVLITDIKSVPEGLWTELLNAYKIVTSWRNIIFYYVSKGEVDEWLVNYLNQKAVYTVLEQSKSNADKSFDDSTHQRFTSLYLLDNRISDEAYKEIAKSCGYYYPNGLSMENLSIAKVKVLIELKKIILVKPTFDLVKTHFPSLIGLLVEKNIEDYFKAPTEFVLEATDFIYLLKSESVLMAFKSSLLPQINNEMITANSELSNLYAKHILEDSPKFDFSSTTLQILMQHGNLLTRRQLFDKYFQTFTNEERLNALTSLGNDFLLIKADGANIEIEATKLNTSIARKLKEIGLIKDLKLTKNELKIINLPAVKTDEDKS